MVEDIRAVELALGSGVKIPQMSELNLRNIVRQQLIAERLIPQGKKIEAADITTARAGQGLSPFLYWDLLGTECEKTYEPGEVIL